MPNLTPFDMADYLDDEEMITEYLSSAAEDEDPKAFLKALRTVSRARGMMVLAVGQQNKKGVIPAKR